jgi:hypothetical protein
VRSYRAGLRSPGRVFAHSVGALRLDSRFFKNAIRTAPFQSGSWQGLFAICEMFASNKSASRVRRIKMLFAECEVFGFFSGFFSRNRESNHGLGPYGALPVPRD